MVGPLFGGAPLLGGLQKRAAYGRQGPPALAICPSIGLALFLSPFAKGPSYLPKLFFSLVSLLIRSGLAESNFLGLNFFQLFVSSYKTPPSNQFHIERLF
jgi:hypothetical protein